MAETFLFVELGVVRHLQVHGRTYIYIQGKGRLGGELVGPVAPTFEEDGAL